MSSAPRVKTLQAQKREFTRSRLLDAALELFATKGYTSTTADDIAAAAGCSRATFYLHFNSRSAAMVGILERAWPDFVVKTAEVVALIDAGLTEDELNRKLSAQLKPWLPQPGAISAFNVAVRVDPVVSTWMDENSSIAYSMLIRASDDQSEEGKERRRARLMVLSHMTMAAYDLLDRKRDQPESWRDEIMKYLSRLWADLLLR